MDKRNRTKKEIQQRKSNRIQENPKLQMNYRGLNSKGTSVQLCECRHCQAVLFPWESSTLCCNNGKLEVPGFKLIHCSTKYVPLLMKMTNMTSAEYHEM